MGLCSYLLINFWFTRLQANKAALKALFMNRFGDVGFLLAVSLFFAKYNTIDFLLLQLLLSTDFSWHSSLIGGGLDLEHSGFYKNQFQLIIFGGVFNLFDLIALFLFLGVVGKSAQLGLHTWLPAAMEGPTPVSALIHAATMVTAGVFLLIRCSLFFEASPTIRIWAIVFGVFTAFFSAFTAIFVFDIKRIIAYSTCSQLGYMVLACGLSEYGVGLFHLLNHAFFKALLFLTAGAVIHGFSNEQDIRKLSGIFSRIPLITTMLLLGSIAILGLPFLSGFYSKDLIIEVCYVTGRAGWSFFIVDFNFVYGVLLLATFFTSIYSTKILYFVVFRPGTGHALRFITAHLTQSKFITISLLVLAVLSIFSGYFLSDLFSTGSLVELLSFSSNTSERFEAEFLPWYIKLAPLLCNGCGVIAV